jgi:hypothetical protein
MKEIEIKLTGSGTVDEISDHLLQLAQALNQHPQGWLKEIPRTWEDPYICAEITEI